MAVQLNGLTQFQDFLFVHQQFFGAHGITIEDISLLIGADVHLLGKQLAVVDRAIRVLEIDVARPQALDLGAKQLDTCLIRFLYKIFVPRFFILRYYLIYN